MYFSRKIALSFISLACMCNAARADIISIFEFTGATNADALKSTDTEANSTTSLLATSFTFIATPGTTGTNSRIRTDVGNPAGSLQASAAELSDNGVSHIKFTVTALSGYELDLSSISFDHLATNTETNNYTVTLKSSIDSFNSVLASRSVPPKTFDASWTPLSAILTDSSFQNLSSIEFRIYFGDANNTGNNRLHRIDNIILNGDVASTAAVPEPSTFILCGSLAALGFAMRRRRIELAVL